MEVLNFKKRNLKKQSVWFVYHIRSIFFLSFVVFFTAGGVQAQSPITLDDISISSITKQAEQGNVNLQFILGNYYHNGKRVKKDLQQAKYWYEKAVSGGNQSAKPLLALIYDEENNYSRAYSLFLSYIENPQNEEKKKVNSLYNMSIGYVGRYKILGNGTTKDLKGAAEWLEKARDNGYDNILIELYSCYSALKNSEKMFTIAKEIYQKIGLPQSLASCYLYGIGCQQDLGKVYGMLNALANGNLNYAASDGSEISLGKSSQYKAQLYIGVANYFDKSKNEHYQEAVKWLNSVATSTDAIKKDRGEALCLLQRCYRFGRGVEKNLEKANQLEEESKKYLSEEEYKEFISHFTASY